MHRMNSRARTPIPLLAVVFAFILGGLLGLASYPLIVRDSRNSLPTVGIGGGPADTQSTNQNAVLLPLNNLLREHSNLAVLHLQAVYDGKDAVPTAQQLDANTQNLANFMSGAFGAEAGSQFAPMWQEHINQYVDYTLALKNNDSAGMDAAKQRLQELAEQKGSMMQSFNQNISANEVTNLMNEHIAGTLSIIDAHASRNQEAMINRIKVGNDQATKFAQYLSDKIAQVSES